MTAVRPRATWICARKERRTRTRALRACWIACAKTCDVSRAQKRRRPWPVGTRRFQPRRRRRPRGCARWEEARPWARRQVCLLSLRRMVQGVCTVASWGVCVSGARHSAWTSASASWARRQTEESKEVRLAQRHRLRVAMTRCGARTQQSRGTTKEAERVLPKKRQATRPRPIMHGSRCITGRGWPQNTTPKKDPS